jgi:hypothetical protein
VQSDWASLMVTLLIDAPKHCHTRAGPRFTESCMLEGIAIADSGDLDAWLVLQTDISSVYLALRELITKRGLVGMTYQSSMKNEVIRRCRRP